MIWMTAFGKAIFVLLLRQLNTGLMFARIFAARQGVRRANTERIQPTNNAVLRQKDRKDVQYLAVGAILLGVATLLFPACAQDGEAPRQQGETADLIVVGYAQVGAESAWRLANTQSFQEAFANSSRYDFTLADCQNSPAVQHAVVYDFIAQEVDYIIIAPIEEDGWGEILAEARDAGIRVIITDRMIDVADDSLYAFWVGGDFWQEGLDAMQWLADHLEEAGGGDEVLNVFHMQGQMGSTAQIGRTEGIEDGLSRNSRLLLREQESGDFTMAKGEEVMRSWLFKYAAEDIDILIAENDDMAFGAIRALQEAGVAPGEDVIIISFDAGRNAVQAVADGLISCTIESNPLQGSLVRENINLLETGVAPQKRQYAHTGKFFDITNAAAEVESRY